VYARSKTLAYEIFERAKMFSQRPSDVALLDERVGDIGRFYFDRGIWAFGRHVASRMAEVGKSSDPGIAETLRLREWERLMGADVSNSATGFADPGAAMAARDEEGDEDIVLDV